MTIQLYDDWDYIQARKSFSNLRMNLMYEPYTIENKALF